MNNQRADFTKRLKDGGFDVGTSMSITEEEKKDVDKDLDIAKSIIENQISEMKHQICALCTGWGH